MTSQTQQGEARQSSLNSGQMLSAMNGFAQTPQGETRRGSLNPGQMLSAMNGFSSSELGQTPPRSSGSSLKTMLSRTRSLKPSTSARNLSQTSLSQDSSSQLSIPEQYLSRISSRSSRLSTSTTEPDQPSTSRIAFDPPPLCEAYTVALRYTLLDSPSVSVDSILRRQASTVLGNSSTPRTPEEATTSRSSKKHKRRMSFSLFYGWTKKLYILVTSGYLLQYTADGHHDRLPERVLQLGPKSVAHASDAISGRPYVLQISQDLSQDDEQTEVDAKSIWSRFGSRITQEKKLAKSFLLVCGSPNELDDWMIAVRREIEACVAAQHSCNTPRAGNSEEISRQSQPSQDTHQTSQNAMSSLADSQNPSDALDAKYEPLPKITTVSMWSEPAFFRRQSSTDSSVNTPTELDNLRESSHGSLSIATGHRLSSEELNFSLSPAEDALPEDCTDMVEKVQESPLQHKSESLQEIVSDLVYETSLSPYDLPSTPLEQPRLDACDDEKSPTASVPNFSLPKLSQKYSRSSVVLSEASSFIKNEGLDIVDPDQNFEAGSGDETMSERRTSTIAPLPPPEILIRKPRPRAASAEHARRRTSSASSTFASYSSQVAYRGSTDAKATPPTSVRPYSLFPRSYSSSNVQKASPGWAPAESDVSGISHGHPHKRSSSTPRMDDPTSVLRVPILRRTTHRPTSMQINLGDSSVIEKPERSPAVTDLHFATNFGTANPFTRSSSILAEAPARSLPQLGLGIRPSKQGTTRSARRKEVTVSMIGPPAGPPPTGPLPAPPSKRVHVRRSSVPIGTTSPGRVFLDLTVDV